MYTERVRDPETGAVYRGDRKGFYDLKPIPKDFIDNRDAWFATVFPYQAMNQPDVVMTHVLFRDEAPVETMKANWEFYKTRSMNFSSMSYVIHSIMAKEMGENNEIPGSRD